MFVFRPAMVMVLRMMCMEGLSHRDMLAPPPLWVWERGCGGSIFVFYVCTPPVMMMVLRIMRMEGRSPIGIRYPRPPLWVWEVGCEYVCIVCMYRWF